MLGNKNYFRKRKENKQKSKLTTTTNNNNKQQQTRKEQQTNKYVIFSFMVNFEIMFIFQCSYSKFTIYL